MFASEATMARPKAPKSSPIRVTEEAVKWARIASGYTGESVVEYASRVLEEQGRKDAERLHSEASKVETPKTKPAKPAR